MRLKVGDTVRLRDGSGYGPLLAEAAVLAGYVGDAWADERGERVSIHYAAARLYVPDLPAEEFVPQPATMPVTIAAP